MGGHGEPGLEGPVVIDGATDITAEGGIGAASRSTLGLTGSSVMKTTTFNVSTELKYNFFFQTMWIGVLCVCYFIKHITHHNIYVPYLWTSLWNKNNVINNHLWDLRKIKNPLWLPSSTCQNTAESGNRSSFDRFFWERRKFLTHVYRPLRALQAWNSSEYKAALCSQGAFGAKFKSNCPSSSMYPTLKRGKGKRMSPCRRGGLLKGSYSKVLPVPGKNHSSLFNLSKISHDQSLLIHSA